MKNNKGFTLVELLVVIVLIVMLSAAAGLSADFSLKKTRKNGYKDTYFDLFKAADLYSELSSFSCDTIEDAGCEVQIWDLIDKGLIDSSIINTINPIYSKGNVKFKNGNVLLIKKINGRKAIQFVCVSSDAKNNDCTKVECKISKDGVYVGTSFTNAYTLNDFHSNDYWGKC